MCDADPSTSIVGISTDSRTAADGGLFFALRGEVHDGHAHVPAARERGALPVVAAGAGIDGPRVEVADTLFALGELARRFVDRETGGNPPPVLAIGGAAGKTTTKALAQAAVTALFGPTLVTAGNLNNRVGVPMTLFTLTPEHRALVIECGTSVRGEIPRLGEIVRPDVALVLNVDLEHSQGLGGLEEIADEEGALLAAARQAAITLHEDPLLIARLARVRAPRRLTFGQGEGTDLRVVARAIEDDGRARVTLALPAALRAAGAPERLEIATALPGPAAALNLAAALLAAAALVHEARSRAATGASRVGPLAPAERNESSPAGLDAADWAHAAAALATVAPVEGRMAPRRIGERLVLDDSYNANPRSVLAALATAGEIAGRRGAHLAVALGDMLELGAHAAAAHREVLAAALATDPALLLLVGPELAAAAATQAPDRRIHLFPDSTAAAKALTTLLAPADLLLVKGSRGLRMERLIEALAAAANV